jgi:hypothetical protein
MEIQFVLQRWQMKPHQIQIQINMTAHQAISPVELEEAVKRKIQLMLVALPDSLLGQSFTRA